MFSCWNSLHFAFCSVFEHGYLVVRWCCRFLPTSIHWLVSFSFSFRLYLLFISIGVDGCRLYNITRTPGNKENFSHIFLVVETHRRCVFMWVRDVSMGDWVDVFQSRLKCISISYGSYKCFDMLEHSVKQKIHPVRKAHIFGSK